MKLEVQAMFYFYDLSRIKLYWAIYKGILLYQIQDWCQMALIMK